MNERVRKTIFIVSVVVLIVSGSVLGKLLWDRAQARGELDDVRQVARPQGVVAPSIEPTEGVSFEGYEPLSREALDELVRINPDFVGWLTVPGTRIDYPVVQGSDNSRYLGVSFEGNRRGTGTVFLDTHAAADFSALNSVLYGHNMQDGTMFHDLVALREQDAYRASSRAYLQTPDGMVRCYEFVSLYVCPADYEYRTIDVDTAEQREAFFERIVARSKVSQGVSLGEGDSILTLSTCVYDYPDARLVVHGRLLAVVPTDD